MHSVICLHSHLHIFSLDIQHASLMCYGTLLCRGMGYRILVILVCTYSFVIQVLYPAATEYSNCKNVQSVAYSSNDMSDESIFHFCYFIIWPLLWHQFVQKNQYFGMLGTRRWRVTCQLSPDDVLVGYLTDVVLTFPENNITIYNFFQRAVD